MNDTRVEACPFEGPYRGEPEAPTTPPPEGRLHTCSAGPRGGLSKHALQGGGPMGPTDVCGCPDNSMPVGAVPGLGAPASGPGSPPVPDLDPEGSIQRGQNDIAQHERGRNGGGCVE
jgi:hypothetical protein